MSDIQILEPQAIPKRAADILVEHAKQLLEQKPYVTIGVVGGRNVAAIFDLLVKEDLDWEDLHFFIIDERLVSLDHKESNYKLLKEHLIDPLGKKLPTENVHPFVYDKTVEDEGTSAYTDVLCQYGGYFDIILLSSGEDGHIGGLYPQHTIKNDAMHFISFHDSPKPPPDRMTSSRKLLLHSQVSILLFVGEAKRDALEKYKNEKIELFDCPAKLVNFIPTSYVLTDLQ